jgi:hypothetical protein
MAASFGLSEPEYRKINGLSIIVSWQPEVDSKRVDECHNCSSLNMLGAPNMNNLYA